MRNITTSSPSERYDWTFHYKFSRPILCNESVDRPGITLVKDSNKLMGLDIRVNNQTDSEASKISEKRAHNLLNILNIKSAMALTVYLTGAEGVSRTGGLGRTIRDFRAVYDIEGKIDKIDLTDSTTEKQIYQHKKSDLESLNIAVTHLNQQRYPESIKESFRIIEHNKSINDYSKYECIRNILSHKDGQLLSDTMRNFIQNFDPPNSSFEFKAYDDGKRIVILDLESSKTLKTLEQVARDLIHEARLLLKL